jgi:hypothetical protein
VVKTKTKEGAAIIYPPGSREAEEAAQQQARQEAWAEENRQRQLQKQVSHDLL